jgi:hypothetical protein
MDSKTTDEHIFSMKYRNFVLMLFSLVVGTNTGTGLIFNQEQNTIQIEYNKERSDRKLKSAIEKAKLELQIETLEKELKYCKDESN